MTLITLPTPTDRDLVIIERCDRKVRVRCLLEIAVVRHACAAVLATGRTIAVDDGGDELALPFGTDIDAIVDAAFAVDDCILLVNHTASGENSWIRLVFGNGGWDVINDHTTNLEEVLELTNNYADALSEWC
jgi:hypothetical protein